MKTIFVFISLSNLLFGQERGWNCPEVATVYSNHSEVQREWAWELLGRFPLKGSEKVLDFGCGDGKITAELSLFNHSGSVTGVDLSSNMIEIAQTRFPKSAYENLSFSQTKTVSFKEISGVYDVICSFSVFHFISEPLEILKNFKEHLQPEGRLLLTVPAPPLSSTLRQAAIETFAKYQIESPWATPLYSKRLSMRSLEGCKYTLEKAEYEVLLIKKVDSLCLFQNIDAYITWLVGTASPNWGIPFEVSHSFFTDVVQRMLELEPDLVDQNGHISMSLPRIHVIAKPLSKSKEKKAILVNKLIP